VSVELPKHFEWLRVESPRLEVSSTDLRTQRDPDSWHVRIRCEN
jgi:hypothetical protein